MKVSCKNCIPKEVEIPEFNDSDKLFLYRQKIKSPINTVKILIEKFELNHVKAKYITTHINIEHGVCNRCSYSFLEQEYEKCPKCNALNFNWKITSND